MKLHFFLAFIAILSVFGSVNVQSVPVPGTDSIQAPPPSGICKESTLPPANGTQITTGFCSSEIQGEIPSENKMVSTVILYPEDGSKIDANKNFTVKIKIMNMNTGYFTNPDTQYFEEPQELGSNGFINGHSHIVIQNFTDDQANFDPDTYAFFAPLNGKADSQGVLTTVVGTAQNPGLPPGKYRLCTEAADSAHQPVLLPVAHGSQDDCVRFEVEGSPNPHYTSYSGGM